MTANRSRELEVYGTWPNETFDKLLPRLDTYTGQSVTLSAVPLQRPRPLRGDRQGQRRRKLRFKSWHPESIIKLFATSKHANKSNRSRNLVKAQQALPLFDKMHNIAALVGRNTTFDPNYFQRDIWSSVKFRANKGLERKCRAPEAKKVLAIEISRRHEAGEPPMTALEIEALFLKAAGYDIVWTKRILTWPFYPEVKFYSHKSLEGLEKLNQVVVGRSPTDHILRSSYKDLYQKIDKTSFVATNPCLPLSYLPCIKKQLYRPLSRF